MRILLISSVLPRDTTGGEVVLYRHFLQWAGLNLLIATDSSANLIAEDIINIQTHPVLYRLRKTRISKWMHDVCQCFPTYSQHQIHHFLKHQKPDLIITVAHGELCWLAQQISQTYGIPLVTFFHDWWPDLAYVHSWTRKIITQRFQKLYQHSKLAFCVSEEMKQALGSHPNSQVLFPIPSQLKPANYQADLRLDQKFTVVYAGNLSDIYSSMIQSLSTIFLNENNLSLKLFGPQPDWPQYLIQKSQDRGIYGGFVSRDVLFHEVQKANALLLTMSFDPKHCRRTQMSLPSKLLEYCQFGKPIIIWGPEDCSAVRWGHKYQSALVVTSPFPKDLLKEFQNLATQPSEQKRLSQKALEMAQSMFNPKKIQQQFLESLYQLHQLKIN